jgi:hypothetical protein
LQLRHRFDNERNAQILQGASAVDALMGWETPEGQRRQGPDAI